MKSGFGGRPIMSNFVLIHGSWHTGARWAPVVARLERSGHKVFAPTVLGHGKGVPKRVNHAQQIQDLVTQIVKADVRILSSLAIPTAAR